MRFGRNKTTESGGPGPTGGAGGAREPPSVPTRSGIRGIFKDKFVKDMLNPVASPYKILVVDEVGAKILNSCMRMNELMNYGVTLVEMIAVKRQPVKSSDAVYFMASTAANIDLLAGDVRGKLYKSFHVFITNALSDPCMARLSSAGISGSLANLVDMHMDFTAPEPLAFHCDIKHDVPQTFGSASGVTAAFTAANHLLDVLNAAGESPTIRYQDSNVAREVAVKLQQLLDESGTQTAEAKSGTIIIVDRTVDPVAACIHELTYEAMLNDLAPLQNGIFRLQGAAGSKPREVPVDMGDPMWCELRHKHIAEVMQSCQQKLKDLKAEFPQLANWDPKSASDGVSLRALGDAVRNLPQFQAKQLHLTVHTDLANVLMAKYESEHLENVIRVEQLVASGRDDNDRPVAVKDAMKEVLQVLREPISRGVRARLVLTCAAAWGNERLDELLKAAAMTNEDRTAVDTLIKTFEPTVKYKTARNRCSPSSKQFFETARYVPFVQSIMEGAIDNTLDLNAFPYVRAPPAGHGAATAAAVAHGGGGSGFGGGANGGAEKSGRFGGLFGKAKAGGSAPTVASAVSASNRKAEAMLDLGHNDMVPLVTKNRVWVFVVGGLLPSEVRAAYTVTRAKGQEVIVGGTSLITQEKFTTDLAIIV